MPPRLSEPAHPSSEASTYAPMQAIPGAPALKIIEEHVKGRGQKAIELKRTPEKKAGHWAVQVAQS